MKETIDEGLTFRNSLDLNLSFHSDSEHGRDASRLTRYGYVIKLNDSIVYYRSKRLPLVTISTTESELMAFVYGLQDTLKLINILRYLNIEPKVKIAYCDNLPAVNILKDETAVGRTKHLDMRILFNRQYLDLFETQLHNCESL